MTKVTNILIASVGGQGGHTLSRVIAYAATGEGLHVRVGESLGMSQRFGSVKSFVRIGDEVRSPTFNIGEADYIICLELIECLRDIHYLKYGGKTLIAPIIKPPFMSRDQYLRISEEALLSKIKQVVEGDTLVINVNHILKEVGNPKVLNMAMLGAFMAVSQLLSLKSVSEAIMQLIPENAVSDSLLALRMGYLLVR